MGVRIRNPSVEICGLPFPLRGVLQGGQRIIVSTTLAVLTAACPSLASTFKLTDLGDDYSGPDDDTTYGITDDAGSETFKDPVRAATTANITLSAAQTIDGYRGRGTATSLVDIVESDPSLGGCCDAVTVVAAGPAHLITYGDAPYWAAEWVVEVWG